MMLLRLFTVALFLVGSCPVDAAQTWRRYTNDRFGTSAEVPPGFTEQTPPANNDGHTFLSADGTARILIFGSLAPSVVVDDFQAYRAWLEEQQGKKGTITYRAGGKTWFALSGTEGETTFYLKVAAGCGGQVAHEVRLEYPAASNTTYSGIVARVAKSLKGQDIDCPR